MGIVLSKIKNFAEWVLLLWGVGAALFTILSYLNLMPLYQIKLIKVNSVTPAFSLFPGTQIRLGIDSYDNSLKTEVATTKWTIMYDLI